MKAKANALRMEKVTKRKVDEGTNAETWTPSKKRRDLIAWWDFISDQLDVSKVLDTNFIFTKIHLMSHLPQQIHRYGAMQQYSAKRHEQAHKSKLKDGWNASNHNRNYLPQAITFQRRILCFESRDLNLQALIKRRENSAATCRVIYSGADLDAGPLCYQSYAEPKFMGPQNCHDRKHRDAVMKDFRALLDNTQDATHCVVVYSGTGQLTKHQGRNKTYILDEQLHTMELWIYLAIQDPVEGLEGERISLMCQCTGCHSWRSGDRRNDRVYVNQCPGRCYGVLTERLPWQLQRLFKIKLLNQD